MGVFFRETRNRRGMKTHAVAANRTTLHMSVPGGKRPRLTHQKWRSKRTDETDETLGVGGFVSFVGVF